VTLDMEMTLCYKTKDLICGKLIDEPDWYDLDK
jgi:hypothetical protein